MDNNLSITSPDRSRSSNVSNNGAIFNNLAITKKY